MSLHNILSDISKQRQQIWISCFLLYEETSDELSVEKWIKIIDNRINKGNTFEFNLKKSAMSVEIQNLFRFESWMTTDLIFIQETWIKKNLRF